MNNLNEFKKKIWKARPDTSTPINAASLNRFEDLFELIVQSIGSGVITEEQLAEYVLKSEGKDLSTNDLTDELLEQLQNANNYAHPENHPPSIITQDIDNRFVTDAEKSTWNAKQESLGVTPENINLDDSPTKFPTNHLVKTFVENIMNGVWNLQGPWNALTNNPDLLNLSTEIGWMWRVNESGTTSIGGYIDWEVGDLVVKTSTGWMQIKKSEMQAFWGNIGGNITDQIDLMGLLPPVIEFEGELFGPTQFWSQNENGFYKDALGTWIIAIDDEGLLTWKNFSDIPQILPDTITGINYVLKVTDGIVVCEELE